MNEVTKHMFTGTARYYSLYRPRYPQELLDDLVRRSVGDHGQSMVDWGCGTGEVALPLSGSFDRIAAVDIDPEMVAVAREKAAQASIANVDWVVGPAEDLELAVSSQDLVVAGSSFHWMDRELLANRAHRALTSSGVIAIVGGGSDVWDVKCAWHGVAVDAMKRWLGEQRRAGSGNYKITKKHADFLKPAGFDLTSEHYLVEHTWDADSIVGYLYSTSFANPSLFEDRLDSFEEDLRRGLTQLSSDDAYPETLDFYVMYGIKRAAN